MARVRHEPYFKDPAVNKLKKKKRGWRRGHSKQKRKKKKLKKGGKKEITWPVL